jgi:hypothetical protein
MNDSREIEIRLRDAAEHLNVQPSIPPEVRRRIRMRRIGTVATSLTILAGLALGVGLAATTSSRNPIHPSQDEDRREIVVTHEDSSLPEGCGVRETTKTLLSFTDAFSQGDVAAVDAAFSRDDSFQWVGIGDPHGLTGEATADRAAVITYLKSRIARNESYRLMNVMVETEIEPRDPQVSDAVRIHFIAKRRATDIDGTLTFRGWAELDCPEGDISMMGFGRLHRSEDIQSWCSASDPDEDAVIACSPGRGGKKSLIFPVLDHNLGEEAGLGGRLVRRRRCLYVRSGNSRTLSFPMWPPGFTHDVAGGVVTVRDGTGTPVARTGSRVTMAGGYHGGEGEGASPPLGFKDEWKPCAPANDYFYVSYVVGEDGSVSTPVEI